MNEAANFFLGLPVSYLKICKVYPPTVEDVLTNSYYDAATQLLTLSEEELHDILLEQEKKSGKTVELISPFQYIFSAAKKDKNFEDLICQSFEFFLHEPVTLLYEQNAIIIGNLEEIKDVQDLRVLREPQYFGLQNLIRASVGMQKIDPPENEADVDPRILKIKAKARYRDRVKAKQAQKNPQKLEKVFAAICCMDCGLNPLNIRQLSYSAIPKIINTFQRKEKYQLDIDALLAGADKKKIHPKYWIE